jgi:signal transduction histidine kinase
MNSIRQRLTRRLLSAVFLLVGCGLVAAYLAMRTALLRNFDETLRAKTQFICTLTEVDKGRVELDFSDRFLRSFGRDMGIDFFQLWRHDGEMIMRGPSLDGYDLPRATGSLSSPRMLEVDFRGRRIRAMGVTFVPLTEDNKQRVPSGMELDLVVASDRTELDRTLGLLAWVLGGCGGVLLAGAGILLPRLLKRGLSPLDHLADESSRMDARTLSRRFPTTGLPDEIRKISEGLNLLLGRLESAFERERRFSADVAHELRTPLAELRNLMEVAIKWPDERDARTDDEILEVTLHMESLVAQMLALARSEHGRVQMEKRRTDLVSEMKAAWQNVSAKAASRSIAADWQMPSTLEVETDPALLRSIVDNLLNNAVEYSPAGSRVSMAARAEGTRFALSIANDAPDFAPEEVGRLFERFWRKDGSRSGGEHAGLGLSLSQAFAELLGWTLEASLDAGKHLTLTLTGSFDLQGPSEILPPRDAALRSKNGEAGIRTLGTF